MKANDADLVRFRRKSYTILVNDSSNSTTHQGGDFVRTEVHQSDRQRGTAETVGGFSSVATGPESSLARQLPVQGGSKRFAPKPDGRALMVICAYNENVKLSNTLSRFPKRSERDYDVLVVDDGSTDGSIESIDTGEFLVHRLGACIGVGAAIRKAIRIAQERDYHVIMFMAGNDKDRPAEIPRILDPVRNQGFALVQGSRYLPGGDFGNMPIYRRITTQFVHPLLFSLAVRKRLTDTTNGFRAIHLGVFDDPAIDIDQPWLDQYEMEVYLRFEVVRLGYLHGEVPCTKIYPPKKLGITKMKPITGWWSILRPIFLLGLGLRR
ncbi:glycosyltransferase [bacterium]|nr:glycosyltransferase [bacterium]